MIISNTAVVAPWVCERCSCPQTQGMESLGLVQDGKLVAGVIYNYFTGKSIEATIAVEGAAPNRFFWWAIFDYPFNQLGVDTILVRINSSNKKSISLMQKLGFTPMGVIPNIYEDGDLILATLVKQDCKMLRSKHGIESENTKSA